ncbi:bifunctional biotin--[acetyl-CoA-carboxylase] synthetase/biotin operon repressor [Pseudoxanthomonas kalamensis DSM 18571]|uniref:bifunctional biotin--[acetyl-CoA-carboxylase] ligase/biotin operon repressor BirA n=1 Tax=Pseudoxanthomonas kalamensis TaxID=289483 RepID=UPI0013917157|nr:bifunctional biotin--[acetyl-CoA-carboxylase] ligase/biotin operon repressor BirA [Pseudoxanthomonas kalamensis]KAF1711977.1 bifunctional biotin--[acetyl-CoA-carboxylase] synthetase/biotin operon repressor [Pseudoxanthomonas kalamensis DSM 18571]
MIDERELLQRLAQGPVTGDALAREGGLTRAAIWKRVQALREAGIDVLARPGQGYALAQVPDLLDRETILAMLGDRIGAGVAEIDIAWELDSTNSELLRRPTPEQGAAVLLAERQTGGRGRRGRDWVSPLAAHLYLSLARHFGGGLARLGGLSLVAGIAAAEALQSMGLDGVRLKWPNDLMVEGRKLGGLLVEGGGEHGGPVRAVIGLGVNVRMPPAVAAAIDQPWTDLQAWLPAPSRNALAAEVLQALLPALDCFDAEGLTPFLPRFAALDALAGREIVVRTGTDEQRGVAGGIAEDGALRLLCGNGELRVHAGEVSVRAA